MRRHDDEPHDEREQASVDKIAALLGRSSMGTLAARVACARTPLSRGQRIADLETATVTVINDDLRQVATVGYGYKSVLAASTTYGRPPSTLRARTLPPAVVMTTITETNDDTTIALSRSVMSPGPEGKSWRLQLRTAAAVEAVTPTTAQRFTVRSATATGRQYTAAKTAITNRFQRTAESLRSRWAIERTRPIDDCNRRFVVLVFASGQDVSSALLPDVLPIYDDARRQMVTWRTHTDPSAGFIDGIFQASCFVMYASTSANDRLLSAWRGIYGGVLEDWCAVPSFQEQWETVGGREFSWKSKGVKFLADGFTADMVLPTAAVIACGVAAEDGKALTSDSALGGIRTVAGPATAEASRNQALATMCAACLDIERASSLLPRAAAQMAHIVTTF